MPNSINRFRSPQRLREPSTATPRLIAPQHTGSFDGSTGRVRAIDLTKSTLSTVAGYPGGFTAEQATARFSRLLLGSVSHQVVTHAPCPTVVVPHRDEQPAVEDRFVVQHLLQRVGQAGLGQDHGVGREQ